MLTNQFRRKILRAGLSAPILVLASCATEPAQPAPILVDVAGVKTVPDLIEAIKRAGGALLPSLVKLEDFLKGIAEAFVESAHAAAAAGYPIPKWILDEFPMSKTAAPTYVQMTIFGVKFLVPLDAIVGAVLYSIAIVTGFIWLVAQEKKAEAEKQKRGKKL